MMEGWVTKRIGDVAETQYGLSTQMNVDGKGFKIFRMGEVQDGSLIDTGRMKYVDISRAEFQRYRLRAGDVLFNRTNSFELVGKTGIFALDGDYCFASYLVRLNLNRDTVLPEFLNYLMNSRSFQESVKGKASKSINQANINATILSNELVCFPQSLSEQERIVAILDEAFAAIATATANAEKNLANVQELFESVLDATITPEANEWRTQELQQDMRFIDYRGRTPKKTKRGLRLITAKNVRMGMLNDEPREHVSPDTYEKWMTRGVPIIGDVLFTTEAPLGLVAQLDTDEKVVFAQRIITLQPDRDLIDPCLLHYVLRSARVQKQIQSNATGATAQGIKASLLKKILIHFPRDVQQQARLAVNLSETEGRCNEVSELRQRKIAVLSELKQSILDKAFSGELTADAKAADRSLSEAGV